MFDEDGREAWGASVDGYGGLRHVRGDRQACPFRWPGQYEDEETGLYYNRFRYYDPTEGLFVSSDPLGLEGGLALRAYVQDPLIWSDPSGLTASGACGSNKTIVLGEKMTRVRVAVRDLRAQNVDAKWYQAWGKNYPKGRHMSPSELDAALARNERWLKTKIAKGYHILDIGPETGRLDPSPFYKLEQSILARMGITPTPLPGY